VQNSNRALLLYLHLHANEIPRTSDTYQGAIRQVDRYIFDYGLGINAIELMATCDDNNTFAVWRAVTY
jgi:hypothetical protein